VLDGAEAPETVDLRGCRLHPLKGEFKGILERDSERKLARDLSVRRPNVRDVQLIDYR
jgi:hypothetical protein